MSAVARELRPPQSVDAREGPRVVLRRDRGQANHRRGGCEVEGKHLRMSAARKPSDVTRATAWPFGAVSRTSVESSGCHRPPLHISCKSKEEAHTGNAAARFFII